ncbi:MAG: thioredoxin family protein [Pedobacter sp.]
MNSVQTIHEKTMLVGDCTLEGLIAFPGFTHYYDKENDGYQPDEETIGALKPLVQGLKIVIVMGTWCGDSLRQVPRFLKVIQELEIPENDVKIIAVDQTKRSFEEQVAVLNIDKVPTFIFSFDGREVGRIVEMPMETLEKDWYYLLTNE